MEIPCVDFSNDEAFHRHKETYCCCDSYGVVLRRSFDVLTNPDGRIRISALVLEDGFLVERVQRIV